MNDPAIEVLLAHGYKYNPEARCWSKEGIQPVERVIEIEFLEWVHPQLGVVPVQVEGGKTLVLKAKLKESK